MVFPHPFVVVLFSVFWVTACMGIVTIRMTNAINQSRAAILEMTEEIPLMKMNVRAPGLLKKAGVSGMTPGFKTWIGFWGLALSQP